MQYFKYLVSHVMIYHPFVFGEVKGSNLESNLVITIDVKTCTYCCYVLCATQIIKLGGMPWSQKGATNYHGQFGLSDKGRAIKAKCWLSVIVGK